MSSQEEQTEADQFVNRNRLIILKDFQRVLLQPAFHFQSVHDGAERDEGWDGRQDLPLGQPPAPRHPRTRDRRLRDGSIGEGQAGGQAKRIQGRSLVTFWRLLVITWAPDILALKHVSRIFGHCNNPALPFCPVCGCGISSYSVPKYWLENEKQEVLGCCNV